MHLRFLWVCLLCLTAASCGDTDLKEARGLVEQYNKAVCEAYRKGDARLVDPVAGPNEGRRLTGLIGVRLDANMILDAELLSLEINEVAKTNNELRVRTSEKWRYCDRRLDTGKQIGEASDDSYEMLYIFKNTNGNWVVDETQFTKPPKVGRKTLPWGTGHGTGNADK
ncbi:MAG: hypothetical protein C0404_01390 [Verrucomicrobia bacterium]|nr:hypothetical protein [Verrucomicrobiota bacterium]